MGRIYRVERDVFWDWPSGIRGCKLTACAQGLLASVRYIFEEQKENLISVQTSE